jgi:acyl-CoA synthetase (AMP-forming)/AMP-acid ligase II
MLARIVAVMEQEGGDHLPSLRTLSYGGARMPVPVLERALELFPNAGFVNAYGLTETSSTVALLGPEDHRRALSSDDPAVRARLGSVGKALPGLEVEVVDEDARPVVPGEEGRIRIRGPQVSGNYVGQDGAVDAEGWLITGDVGTVDAEGYIFVQGRADDVIIAGGENLSPGEIEDSLLRHPSVDGAAVVGLPDDEWGERVAAMVTVSGQVDPDELAEWVRKELGGLKSPKVIAIRDELPMTPTGKVLRREVRAELAAPPA